MPVPLPQLKGNSFLKKLAYRLLRPRRFAVLEACIIGLASALAAILLERSVGWIGSIRIELAQRFPAYWVLPLMGLLGGILAGWIVERFAPETSGSGMLEVKAVLANVPMPLDLRIAGFKFLGSMLVLGAGIPLGREGPTVQIAAALSTELSRWTPTSPEHRRQLIAAGAGAGLAAAFNAPIAGVLFVVEELLRDISGLTLGTAILASFIAGVVTRAVGSHSLDLNLNLIYPDTQFFAEEIPFYVGLGILAGLLGCLFNQGVLASVRGFRHLTRFSLPLRIGLVGLICGVAFALLPEPFRNNAGLRQLLLTGQADWQLTAIAFIVQFSLVVLASGSGAPGGLLVPTLVLGSALGSWVGGLDHHMSGLGQPVTFAQVGMGAFFGAVTRVPITAVVLVFEMTTDFNLVLPLMISSVVAWLVGERLMPESLYEHLLKAKGIHLEDAPAPGIWMQLTAAEVMQPQVETLAAQMSVEEALQAFSQSTHHTFPVLDAGRLVGILTQKDLSKVPKRSANQTQTVREVMTPEPVSVKPTDTLAHIMHLLNHFNLSSLPVTEGQRLIGIITRTDIIRAEVAHLNGEPEVTRPQTEPARVIYQTRMPETGRGKILLPISNPETAGPLLKIALAIARDRHYDIECLKIIVIPQHQSLTETAVNSTAAQRLLQQAQQQAALGPVSVHTQIQVSHDLASALLQTIKACHVDLVIMGWKGRTLTPGRIYSRVVDTVIRQAPCQVMLVKLSRHPQFDRWLVPMAGGPNARQAIQLLPALTALGKTTQVKLCQVFDASHSALNTKLLDQTVEKLQTDLGEAISAVSLKANSIAEAILAYAQTDQSDVIVIGASRESLLKQAINGNIPAIIAHNSECTVILMRSVWFGDNGEASNHIAHHE